MQIALVVFLSVNISVSEPSGYFSRPTVAQEKLPGHFSREDLSSVDSAHTGARLKQQTGKRTSSPAPGRGSEVLSHYTASSVTF